MSLISSKAAYKKFIEERERENEAESYSDYKRRKGSTIDKKYASAIEELLLEKRRAGGGTLGERLASGGISGGYAEYLTRLDAGDYGAKRRELEEKRDFDEGKIRGNYLSYIERYNKKQNSIRTKVVDRLTELDAIDEEDIYRHAIESGLNKKEAKSVAVSVLSATRGKVKKELLESVFRFEITPDTAVTMAKSYGLPKEDIDFIAEMSREYRKKYESASKDFLEYLDNLGDANTGTYNKNNFKFD